MRNTAAGFDVPVQWNQSLPKVLSAEYSSDDIPWMQSLNGEYRMFERLTDYSDSESCILSHSSVAFAVCRERSLLI